MTVSPPVRRPGLLGTALLVSVAWAAPGLGAWYLPPGTLLGFVPLPTAGKEVGQMTDAELEAAAATRTNDVIVKERERNAALVDSRKQIDLVTDLLTKFDEEKERSDPRLAEDFHRQLLGQPADQAVTKSQNDLLDKYKKEIKTAIEAEKTANDKAIAANRELHQRMADLQEARMEQSRRKAKARWNVGSKTP